MAPGFRFQVREEVHAWVRGCGAERQTRYSRALLETLALIAYRQPMTRGEIEQIRGVASNTNMVRALRRTRMDPRGRLSRGARKPALFGTTKTFLDYFNLKASTSCRR